MVPSSSSGGYRKRRYWQDLIERCRESGKSVRAFCLAAGVKLSAFYRWRRKLTPPAADAAGASLATPPARRCPPAAASRRRATGRFLPVTVLGSPPVEKDLAVEICLPAGPAVRVRPGFDPETLTEVLDLLEARSC